jgi:hypothetical protein
MPEIRQFKTHVVFEVVQHPTVKQEKKYDIFFKETRKMYQLLPQFI